MQRVLWPVACWLARKPRPPEAQPAEGSRRAVCGLGSKVLQWLLAQLQLWSKAQS
jgi:hypothetical protein